VGYGVWGGHTCNRFHDSGIVQFHKVSCFHTDYFPSEKGVEFPSGWRVLYCGISEAKRVCPDMFESINFQLLNSSHEYSSRRWCSVEG